MAKYIDADALMEELSTMYKEPTSTEDYMTIGYDKAVADVVVTVHRQTTADVVEVVRCKDCVHHINAPQTTDVWCERIDGLLQRNWFCADGERRYKETNK